jgi:hypothetical protein
MVPLENRRVVFQCLAAFKQVSVVALMVYVSLTHLSLVRGLIVSEKVFPSCKLYQVLHTPMHSSRRCIAPCGWINVTPAEFYALGEAQKHQVSAAYKWRYGRLRGYRGYAFENGQGVKRVDFLMGYTKCRGISSTAGASDVWEVNIS